VNNRLKGGLIGAAAVAALAGGGAAIAGATGAGDDGSGQPITGSALDKAKTVALHETGGGHVSATEVRDEEGYYEVEVTRDDGSQVDVHLDSHFNVLNQRGDGGDSGGEN
jgi:uncharacterized membrane protein YkoI